MEVALGILLGLGLSAACGFRVFVPLLIASAASCKGYVVLAPGFEWIGTTPALVAFGAATAIEIGGYYIPVVDNFLDTIAGPAAVIAGIILSASFIEGVHPVMKWSLAIIAGGGAAGGIKLGASAIRAVSSFATGGLGNPVVSTVESITSVFLSVLSILLPIAVIIVFLVLGYFAVRKLAGLYARAT